MNVVILAAGMGKRMRSDLPKVLHPIAGQPMLAHVIDRARSLSPKRLVVVYGHGGEQVPTLMAADDITWAVRSPDVVEKLRAIGANAEGGSPEDFRKLIASESLKWGQLARELGMKPE